MRNNAGFIERRNAYHEAGHAVVSYLVGLPFKRINLDADSEMNNNPGVEWDSEVIEGPKFADDKGAGFRHQRCILTIDFGGRAAERLIRIREIPFPSLVPDGIELSPHIDDTAKSDLFEAWKRYVRMETLKQGKRQILSFECPPLLENFEREYQSVCLLLNEEKHRTRIDALAVALIAKRRMTYEEAQQIIEHA